jgi:outer membrane protein assembly factor BamB
MDYVPDITSPASDGELLFTLPGGGTLACFELKTGKKLWDHSFEKDCQASPALVGRRLYLFTTEGEGIIVNAAREFTEVGRGKLGEPVHASPAFVQDRMIVRTEKHLVCIGAKPGKEAASAR